MPKIEKSRGKALSVVLAVFMLCLGVGCFLVSTQMMIGMQYLAFFCLALYGAVLVTRYFSAEPKKLPFLLGGVVCILLGGLILGIWLLRSYEAAEGYMSFVLCIALAALSVTMGVNRFTLAFALKRKGSRPKDRWLFGACALDFIVGVFLVIFPILFQVFSVNMILGIYLCAGGLTMMVEAMTKEKAPKEASE